MGKNSKKNKNKTNSQAKSKVPEVTEVVITEDNKHSENVVVDQPELNQASVQSQPQNNSTDEEEKEILLQANSVNTTFFKEEDNSQSTLLEEKLKDLEAKLTASNNEVEQFKTKELEQQATLQVLRDSHEKEMAKLQSTIDNLTAEKTSRFDDEKSEHGIQEIKDLKTKLEQATKAKEDSHKQYQNLLGKVSTIKATLGERLKTDAAEIAKNKKVISLLEEEKHSITASLETIKKELILSNQETENLSSELSTVRLEYQNSMEKWDSKYDSLVKENRKAYEEIERTSNLIKSLEVSLSEEKTLRVNLDSKTKDLGDQIKTQINYAEQYRRERDDAKSENAKLAEQLEMLTKFSADKTEALSLEIKTIQEQLEKTKNELQKSDIQVTELQKANENIPVLEQEVKEKNLQLGKLRHEAVTLNEHLTRALRMIQKTSQGDTVDKELITNMLLSFLSLPRADTKRFEVLNLISNYLGWDENQNIQAGLTRSGAVSGKSLLSPRGRSEESSGGFMSMFADFLERESSKSGK